MTIDSHAAVEAAEPAGAPGWRPDGDFWLTLAVGLVANGLALYSAWILRKTLNQHENKDVEKGENGTK